VDRGYEGDSGYLAHLGSAAGSDRWSAGPREPGRRDTVPSPSGGAEIDSDAAAGVARRLQARLDRHLWLLERLQAEQLYPEPPGLPELQDTARRMRRDTESLLLLSGDEPGVRSSGPRRLADLVADAAGAAEEPRRVDVRTAPAALVAPAAAVEFVHVLVELVDHVTAVYPGARIELVSRLEPPVGPRAGATVDVLVDGAARHDPDGLGGRRAVAAAEQLARRSRHGIALHRPPGGPPPTAPGLVASVHCPPAAVTVEEPAPLPPREPRINGSAINGSAINGSALGSYNLDLGSKRGGDLNRDLGSKVSGDLNPDLNPDLGSKVNRDLNGDLGIGRAAGGPNGSGPSSDTEPRNGAVRPSLSFDETPTYSPSSSSQVDELFGPLLDLPLEPIDDRYATPIFEAIASAWFREDGSGGEPGRSDALDWETPQDDEWREAAARAARSEPIPTTSTGLPRRQPGNQLVPPPRRTSKNGQNSQNSTNGQNSEQNGSSQPERVPDRVRDRLSTYQRGLREGRHRAPGSEGSEPE
jgi:hypothetical protein